MVMRWSHTIVLLSLVLLAGCGKEQWDDCITSAGPIRTEERSIGTFSKVVLYDRVDLVLEERDAGTVEVEAGRNLLAQVITKMEGDVLVVTNTNTCNWVRSFKPRITVRVPIQQAAFLELKGTGNVSAASTVRRGEFRIEQGGGQGTAIIDVDVDICVAGMHSGAGNVVFTGRAGLAFLYSASMAPIDASGLDAERVLVNNSGVTDIRCRASEHLDAQINNIGSIYYSGQPMVSSSIHGDGRLVHVE
jgi:hypothetical protein